MYEIMFDRYPVVNNLFNTTHIRKTGDTNSVPPQVQKMNYKLKIILISP
jgi:hemoglobin-like flavoprotein